MRSCKNMEQNNGLTRKALKKNNCFTRTGKIMKEQIKILEEPEEK